MLHKVVVLGRHLLSQQRLLEYALASPLPMANGGMAVGCSWMLLAQMKPQIIATAVIFFLQCAKCSMDSPPWMKTPGSVELGHRTFYTKWYELSSIPRVSGGYAGDALRVNSSGQAINPPSWARKAARCRSRGLLTPKDVWTSLDSLGGCNVTSVQTAICMELSDSIRQSAKAFDMSNLFIALYVCFRFHLEIMIFNVFPKYII